MAKKKHRRALLDVLSGEKDLARSLSDWSVSEHPAATGGTFVADTAKKAAQAAARPEPGVGVVRLTYTQTAVLVLLVLAMVLAAFFVGKRFGT
ncbi:MAG: hypothetical protein QGD94_01015, partial [Planctomycetia bacterium]|nr:hypothetical protein [Planctomycetia bacterium]